MPPSINPAANFHKPPALQKTTERIRELIESDPGQMPEDPDYEVWNRACQTGILHPDQVEVVLRILSEIQTHHLAIDEFEYDSIRNPIIIFRAVAYCHQPPRQRLRGFLPRMLNGQEPNWFEDALKLVPEVLPCPDWCWPYFGRVARKIEQLDEIEEIEIENGKKADLVKEVLELTDDCGNAFKHMNTHRQNNKLREMVEFEKLAFGKSQAEAFEKLRLQLNISDLRQFKRRISIASRTMKWRGGRN